MESYEILRNPKNRREFSEILGIVRIPVNSYEFLQIPINSCKFLWIPVDSCKFLLIPMDSCGFL